mmetsp:Transcript_29710/g.59446  ORF Transcript_29710/g.59446 Transcript_29710/m.59446 type:complete len:567 (+) Transcript_29710:134-1834(+)
MASPNRVRTRNRIDEFVLPDEDGERVVNVPSINASASLASSLDGKSPVESASRAAWGRAIDRYVASVLEEHRNGSQPDELKVFSLAQNIEKSAAIDTGIPSLDDASFAPFNPFEGDTTQREKSTSERIREHWKLLAVICFGLSLILFVSAGVASRGGAKSTEAGTNVVTTPETPVVGVLIPSFSPTPSRSGSPTPNPTVPPTYNPTGESPTYLPSGNPIAAPTTIAPTTFPSPDPSSAPSFEPSQNPSRGPSYAPSTTPTIKASFLPSSSPTLSPTAKPTMPGKYFEMKKAAEYVSGNDAFNSTSTAQSLAFHWLYFEGNPSSNIYEFFEQYAVAVVFFSLTRARMRSVGGNYGLAQDDFTSRREVCGWSGLRCAYNYTSEMSHVTEIKLAGKELTGTIPSEIRFLPYLTRLDLSDNEIVGTIPEDLYFLRRLRHLYLNNNHLEGTISDKLDNLNGAEHIYLGQNDLTGTLPSNIGTNRPNEWRMFSVYNNSLSGSIPSGMRLRNAYVLDFSRNQFSGHLPANIEQSEYSKLRLLYLDRNQFTGTIPPYLSQLRKLKGLFLNVRMM